MLPDVNKQPQAPAIVNHGLLFGHSFSPMLEHILKNAEQEQASHLGSAIRHSATGKRKAANKASVRVHPLFGVQP